LITSIVIEGQETNVTDRDNEIEASLSVMRSTLESIAARNDCDYCMEPDSTRIKPCPCAKCVATSALRVVDNWRFMGARHGRVATMPRERKMMNAWKAQVDDRLLGMVLSDDDPVVPTPRDWYVASSVVQWLATNVGMEVLRLAGWKYEGYEEDRKEIDQRREP
jgi:hypothetical protein